MPDLISRLAGVNQPPRKRWSFIWTLRALMVVGTIASVIAYKTTQFRVLHRQTQFLRATSPAQRTERFREYVALAFPKLELNDDDRVVATAEFRTQQKAYLAVMTQQDSQAAALHVIEPAGWFGAAKLLSDREPSCRLPRIGTRLEWAASVSTGPIGVTFEFDTPRLTLEVTVIGTEPAATLTRHGER